VRGHLADKVVLVVEWMNAERVWAQAQGYMTAHHPADLFLVAAVGYLSPAHFAEQSRMVGLMLAGPGRLDLEMGDSLLVDVQD